VDLVAHQKVHREAVVGIVPIPVRCLARSRLISFHSCNCGIFIGWCPHIGRPTFINAVCVAHVSLRLLQFSELIGLPGIDNDKAARISL